MYLRRSLELLKLSQRILHFDYYLIFDEFHLQFLLFFKSSSFGFVSLS
jgi:hypothetical protein